MRTSLTSAERQWLHWQDIDAMTDSEWRTFVANDPAGIDHVGAMSGGGHIPAMSGTAPFAQSIGDGTGIGGTATIVQHPHCRQAAGPDGEHAAVAFAERQRSIGPDAIPLGAYATLTVAGNIVGWFFPRHANGSTGCDDGCTPTAHTDGCRQRTSRNGTATGSRTTGRRSTCGRCLQCGRCLAAAKRAERRHRTTDRHAAAVARIATIERNIANDERERTGVNVDGIALAVDAASGTGMDGGDH